MVRKADPRVTDFISRVRKRFKISAAYLFGSRARGDFLKSSDFDVILVSDDFEGVFFSKRIAQTYPFWRHYPEEIEPLCYTPEEFEKKRRETGIVKTAVSEGIRLV